MKTNYFKSIILAFPILFISLGTFAQTPCQTLAYGAFYQMEFIMLKQNLVILQK